MRILVISNFYPPHHIGGYELGCADVVRGLERRGHEVCVLTSRRGADAVVQSDGVYRLLRADCVPPEQAASQSVARILLKDLANRRAMKRVCSKFKPDLVYVWNAAGISTSVIVAAQSMMRPVCYFVSDCWLSRWETDACYSLNTRNPRRVSRRLAWK